jgi:hypothetical protein
VCRENPEANLATDFTDGTEGVEFNREAGRAGKPHAAFWFPSGGFHNRIPVMLVLHARWKGPTALLVKPKLYDHIQKQIEAAR